MAVKKPIYITEKGYTQEINADLDSIEINSIQITAGGDIKVGAADGYGVYPIVMSDDGYVSFASGAFCVNPDGSVVSAAGALQVGADGALTVGTGAETASIDADGYMILSAIETTATDGYAILTEGGKFYVRASDGYVKIGGFAQLQSGMSLGSDLAVAGGLTVQQLADFNNGVQANAIKIDGDVAQRLYIVDADGYMKDEQKLVFDGYGLSVDGNGSFSGSLSVSQSADLNSSLDVAGQVDLAASGVATSVRGTLNVAQDAVFSADLVANQIAIAGDVAQRLYIVDADGYMKDEQKLVFDGYGLSVDGNGSFSGSLSVSQSANLDAALDVAGQVDLAASGVATNVRGTLSVAEVADFNAGLLSSGVKIDNDVAQRLYIVGDDGYLKDESKLVFDGYGLSVDGNGSFSGNFQVAGTSSFQGLVDFNGGFTVSNIKIDGDVAQRLYIVDADGYIKDEEKLTFDGSKLSVDGDLEITGDMKVSGNDIKSSSGSVAITLSGADVAVAGNLTVTGNDIKSSTATAITLSGADVIVAGDLKVSGNDIKSGSDVIALTLSGADVNVKGNLTVDGNIVADADEDKSIFAAVSTGHTVTIASAGAEVALPSAKVADLTSGRIVLAGTAGALEDSANLTFSAGLLSVDADGYFSGALEVAGAVSLHDDMSFVANKSISFAGNSGSVLGLADLDGYSDGYTAANKNYVDMMVAAAGLDAGNTSSSSLLAAESISIGDPIFIDSNGKAARGDTTSTLNEKAWVFGVAAAAAATDASVEVVRDGIAAGVLAGLGMSAGAKVWLAAGGGLTATKPTAGRLILMGFALSSSDLLVDVRDYGSFVA